MDIYIGLFISFIIILFSILKNVFVGFPLMICWFLFSLISLKRGYSIKSIFAMSYSGIKKSLVVVRILILIGAVTGAWMSAGTLPGIVYYSLKFIQPDTFILFSFLICCLSSFLLGSAVGTASIIGLPLIILAKSANVDLNIAAGAIISGVYFGDRCSPMSSSAALVSNLTDSNLLTNIKNMLRSSVIPLFLSIIFYYILSKINPLRIVNNNMTNELMNAFKIGYMTLIPILIMLVLCVVKVKIEYSMLLSTAAAAVISVLVQGRNLLQVLESIFFGFRLDNSNALHNIIKGGGVTSMLKTCFIILIACALAGILEGIKTFDPIKKVLFNLKPTGYLLYGMTTVISTITAAFGCTQSIAVIMTDQIMKECYKADENYKFALHLENSCILTSALIPWNIAALLCTSTLNVSMYGFIPYAFFIYIFPVTYFLETFIAEKINSSKIHRQMVKF